MRWAMPSAASARRKKGAAAVVAAAVPVAARVRNSEKRTSCIRGPFFMGFRKEKLAITVSFDYNKLNYYLLNEVTLCT